MTERERLIELINNGTDGYRIAPIINGVRDSLAEYTADYLLANGVIVPPCKVGDEVYCILLGEITEYEIASYIFDEKISFVNLVRMEGFKAYGKTVSVGEFCKYYYTTKEEAEKALAERSEGK